MADDAVLSEIPGDFEETYGYAFRDPELIRLAMVDPSYVRPRGPRRGRPHNRRLEHVGDAAIRLHLRLYLFHAFPYYETSDMEERVSHWVSNRVLADVARNIDLAGFLLYEAEDGDITERQLACGIEAVLGALMIDGGCDAVRAFVSKWVIPNLPAFAVMVGADNPKGALQTRVVRRGMENPFYATVSDGDETGERVVVVEAWANERLLGTGRGRSPRDASVAAARDALSRLEDRP